MPIGYLVKRVGQFFLVLWLAATLNFLLPRFAPGNPIRERLISQASQGGPLQEGIQEMVRAYNIEFGLDKPLWVQYGRYLYHVFQLDFGYSITAYPARVMPMILAALPWTIGLLLTASILSFAIGTLLGALIGWPRAPKFLRQFLLPPMITLAAIPYYLLGLVLVYLLSVRFAVFPISGGYSIGTIPALSPAFLLDVVRHSLLPGMSLVLVQIGFSALAMRGMMVTTYGEDYVTFAEAKGLKGWRIFFSYALRNAILPQVTGFVLALGQVISGSVVVEAIFGYPGMGSLLIRAISGLDYFLIYGIVFMTVLTIALATLLVDLIYPILDPRISYRRT